MLIILHGNTISFMIASILHQYVSFGSVSPVNINFQLWLYICQICNVSDQKLLDIIDNSIQWWYNLEGGNHEILTHCKDKNLKYIQMSNLLSRMQA
jgi:hypothetical protein